jgi:uncharacterized protein (DUF2164 family)
MITLPAETSNQLYESIKQFFATHLDEEIGDLKARLVLDYCLKEIGPTIYNQAIADAQKNLQARVQDLDCECFEIEFGYWTSRNS